MTDEQKPPAEDSAPLGPVTVPADCKIIVTGFDNETASLFGRRVGDVITHISRYIDLSSLDGATVSTDYRQALIDLDRGGSFEKLMPSEGDVIGVAMSPQVLRGGILKTHMVFNAEIIGHIADFESENFGLALQVIAHECGHVMDYNVLDTSFPGILLKKKVSNIYDHAVSDIGLACWTEYAATYLSAPFGENPHKGYEETFLKSLKSARSAGNDAIIAYRTHADLHRLVREVSIVYGNLMKYGSYLYGNISGRNEKLVDFNDLQSALSGHWFAPYFERQTRLLDGLASNYGKWNSISEIEQLGVLAIEVMSHCGVCIEQLDGDNCYVDVPFSLETMPF